MKLLDYKNWSLKKIFKEIAILVVMVLVISNVMSYIRKPNLDNSELPMIKEMMIDGKVFDSRTFHGKPLMIHFWATWCPVCKTEADNIQRLSKYYDIVTIAVKSGSDEEISDYLKGRGFDYRVINDRDAKWAKLFDVQAFPTTFIFDRDGAISFSEVGYTSTLGLAVRMWWAGL